MLRIKQTSASTYEQQYVPLKKVTIETNIKSFAADVTIKQVFRNDESTPIEAVYCFPIEEQAAIYAFIAHIDDRQIIAQLKEKKQAQQDYNQALQQGHGAYLLEQDEKSPDNFIINVGALPSGKECHIQISYVTELDLVQHGTKVRFVVPTTIAPRYNPNKGGTASPAGSVLSSGGARAFSPPRRSILPPRESRFLRLILCFCPPSPPKIGLRPPGEKNLDKTLPAGTTANYIQSAPYTIDFRCQIDKTNVARVSSTSHPIQVDLSHDDVYFIEFGQQSTHLDRDIIIDIELAKNRSNTILAVENGAVMASFTPNQQDCQRAIGSTKVTNEFIFVVDCSGSMQDENKIGFARQAMLLFLKSLPLNCHFNIIQFGSTYQTLFNNVTAIYNKEHAQQAEQLTNNMQANLGGTELLQPLQWLNEHPSAAGRARQIFVMTDGEISNVDQVLDLCRSMSTSTRIFSFGLGRSPSRSLIKGLARATNGRFVFIPPDTNVDVYVGEQLEKALQSSITNIQVQWNLGRNVTKVPTKTPPVYVNDRLIVYALANDDNESHVFYHNSSVELYNDQHRIGEAKVTRILNVSDNGTIGRLAAKALILELQHSKLSLLNNKSGSRQARFEEQAEQEREKLMNDEKEERKKRIIELSLKYNILSPYTAFVGIEKRVNGNNADMILREVPIEISADDHHLQRSSYMNASHTFLASMAMHCPETSRTLAGGFNRSVLESAIRLPRALIYENFQMSPSYAQDMSMHSRMDICNCTIQNQSAIITDYPLSHRFAADDDAEDLSSLIEKLGRKSSISKRKRAEETFPTDDENIVRYLINKQMFDGLWELNSKEIEQLTSKPLSHFQQLADSEVLLTGIIIVVLETRFASFSSMWYGVVQKARQHLLGLLANDNKKLDTLLEDIHQKL